MLLFGTGGEVDGSGNLGALRAPGYQVAVEHSERHPCCKVTNSMPWSPKSEANCPASIKAKGKAPFPRRRLPWLGCEGTSGTGKDVYNLCRDGVPSGIPFVCLHSAFRSASNTKHVHHCIDPHSSLSSLSVEELALHILLSI